MQRAGGKHAVLLVLLAVLGTAACLVLSCRPMLPPHSSCGLLFMCADELPQELYNLLDAAAHVRLPAAGAPGLRLNNWKLDKLVSQLGKNKGTWRRAIVLYEWLKVGFRQRTASGNVQLVQACMPCAV
eukprot:362866-Chlamydomonas_euryale.AAC.9